MSPPSRAPGPRPGSTCPPGCAAHGPRRAAQHQPDQAGHGAQEAELWRRNTKILETKTT